MFVVLVRLQCGHESYLTDLGSRWETTEQPEHATRFAGELAARAVAGLFESRRAESGERVVTLVVPVTDGADRSANSRSDADGWAPISLRPKGPVVPSTVPQVEP